MHLYNTNKRKIATDRPQGVNIPSTPRRIIKVTSGDTMWFTANVTCPSTHEPVKHKDLPYTHIYVAVAEDRFSPVMWVGSSDDKWVILDDYRPGLIHVCLPRTLMNALRRGAYSFSVVVDDGVVRTTQLTGTFQVEYEPMGAINDIPYRRDQKSSDPMYLTPELDLASQPDGRLSEEQLIRAVNTIAHTILENRRITSLFDDPSIRNFDDAEAVVKKIAKLILDDDNLRSKIPMVTDIYCPPYGQLLDNIEELIRTGTLTFD